MTRRCWKDKREYVREHYGYGSAEWQATFQSRGNGSCMLPEGHAGPHVFTPDEDITVTFQSPKIWPKTLEGQSIGVDEYLPELSPRLEARYTITCRFIPKGGFYSMFDTKQERHELRIVLGVLAVVAAIALAVYLPWYLMLYRGIAASIADPSFWNILRAAAFPVGFLPGGFLLFIGCWLLGGR